jgi:hypothetical protein
VLPGSVNGSTRADLEAVLEALGSSIRSAAEYGGKDSPGKKSILRVAFQSPDASIALGGQ